MCQLVYTFGKINANHYQNLLHPLTLKLIGEPLKLSLKGQKKSLCVEEIMNFM